MRTPSTGRRWPSTRTCGGVFVVRCRSEPPISMSFFSRSESESGSWGCSCPVMWFPCVGWFGRRGPWRVGGGGPGPPRPPASSLLRGRVAARGGLERGHELLGAGRDGRGELEGGRRREAVEAAVDLGEVEGQGLRRGARRARLRLHDEDPAAAQFLHEVVRHPAAF